MAATTRTIIVAVDASEHSKQAFEWYLGNVFRPDDLVVLCHMAETPKLPIFSVKDGLNLPVEEWQKAIQEQIDRVQKLESDYMTDLIPKKIHHKFRSEQYRTPGEGIMAVAETENASLIVMGTRGLDVVRRTLLGSVSDYVVRHSHIPVLICPKKGDHHHQMVQ